MIGPKLRPEAKLVLQNLKDHLKGMRESLQTISFKPPAEAFPVVRPRALAEAPPGESVMSLDYRVIVVEGKRAGEIFDVGRIITFGRAENCEVQLTDIAVSREHCRIVFHPERRVFLLQDLGSHNGTLLNQSSVRKAELKSGDRIKVGEATIVFYREPLPEELRSELTRKGIHVSGEISPPRVPETIGTRERTPSASGIPGGILEEDEEGVCITARSLAAVRIADPAAPEDGATRQGEVSQEEEDLATLQLPAFASRPRQAAVQAPLSEPEITGYEPTMSTSAIDDAAEDIGDGETAVAAPSPEEQASAVTRPAAQAEEGQPATHRSAGEVPKFPAPDLFQISGVLHVPASPTNKASTVETAKGASHGGDQRVVQQRPAQEARPAGGKKEKKGKKDRKDRRDRKDKPASQDAAPPAAAAPASPSSAAARQPAGGMAGGSAGARPAAPASSSPARPDPPRSRSAAREAVASSVDHPTTMVEQQSGGSKVFLVLLSLVAIACVVALLWYLSHQGG